MRIYGRLETFESRDGLETIELSPWDAEWDSSQDIQSGIAGVFGADFGQDLWGASPAPLDIANERLRALVANEDVDHVRNRLYEIGRGRLWVKLHDGSSRWAWARLEELPGFGLQPRDLDDVPLIIPFLRLSSWYGETQQEVTEHITGGSGSITVDTDGLARTRNIEIEIEARSADGYDDPEFENASTVESFWIDHTAAEGDVHRLNVLAFRLDEHESGAAWTEETQKLKLGGNQVSPMSLVAGLNVIEIDNVQDADVTIRWYDAWR